MKRILVPIDFSESSEYPLEVAAGLAKQNKAETVMLHIFGISKVLLKKMKPKNSWRHRLPRLHLQQLK